MAKKKKPFVIATSTNDRTVGFGKYKSKKLIWVAHNDIEFFKNIETLYYPKYDDLKKKYYKSLFKKFVTGNGLISKPDLTDKIGEVVSLLRERKNSKEIYDYLGEKYSIEGADAKAIISDAIVTIRREFELEKSFLLDVHLVRYEETYLKNFNADLSNVPPGYRKAVQAEHMITAMETLFQKEKLLGIHTKNFKLKSSNKLLKRSDTEFDVTRLTPKERLRAYELLKKARNIEELVRPLLPSSNPLDIDVVKKEDHMLDSPIKESTQTDIIGDEEKKNVKPEGRTLEEVHEKIENNLKEKVKKLLDGKNKK